MRGVMREGDPNVDIINSISSLKSRHTLPCFYEGRAILQYSKVTTPISSKSVLLCLGKNFVMMAFATTKPSTAAETIPPAKPAP